MSERDLFANFARMRREMDEMLTGTWGRGTYISRRASGFSPNVDVYYSGDPQRAVVKCDLAGIDLTSVGIEVSGRQLTELAAFLQQLTLTVSGTRGYREAMVTAGGVRLDTVDPRTLMSRLVPGLFLAGEVLDIDGDTGGYNLQAAFSTGSLAGFSAARYA